MQELIMPQAGFSIVANPLANLPGRETVFDLRRHAGEMPAGLFWQLIGRGPDFDYDSGPTRAVVSVQARFKAAGIHSLRAMDCGSPAGCLAEHKYPVFDPKYGELLVALLGRQAGEASRRFARHYEACLDGEEQQKLVADLEHALPLPGIGPDVLALLLGAGYIKDFLRRRTRSFGRNVMDLDELCQELFAKICPKLKDYKPEGKFHAYVATAAYRLCVDDSRRQQRARDFTHRTDSEPVASEDLGALIDYRERLKQLSAEDFKLLISHYNLGMGYHEIADMMGIPGGLPRNTRITRARRRIEFIKNWLRGSDNAPPSGTGG